MWTAKLISTTKDSIFGEIANKFNVSIEAFPISFERKNRKLVVKAAGFVTESKNKSKFLRCLKKTKAIKKIKIIENFAIGIFEAPLRNIPLYTPEIIWVKPVKIFNGFEEYEIASWDKKYINDFINCLEKFGCRILKLKKENLPGVSFIGFSPNLTKKQKQAFSLAVLNGYYNYPKNIKMESLGKIMGVSYSTYQEHLKKAENKLIPFISKISK